MKKFFKQFSILFCLITVLVLPYFVFAETPLERLQNVGYNNGAGPYTEVKDELAVSRILGTAVGAFLSFLGVIFIILMVYGGYIYMNARGNDDDVKRSLTLIRQAIIGLVIVVGAYAIWTFVIKYI